MTDNLKYWNAMNQPPSWALKTIQAGRLKGKSDINPQWRYMAMTEVFGSCGIGWKFTIDKTWTEIGAKSEVMVFVNVLLYIKTDEGWSEPIPGNGGSTLIAAESAGMHNNDEAYKMAITDALSTAMKMIGVAADIYAGLFDGSKYQGQQNKKAVAPAKVTAPPAPSSRPYSAEMVKQKVEERTQYHVKKQTTASVNDRKVLASILDGVLIDVTKRYELSKWLVGQASTQKMTQPSVNALFDWLGTERVFNATPSDDVVKEIHSAHTAALKASGQQELI